MGDNDSNSSSSDCSGESIQSGDPTMPGTSKTKRKASPKTSNTKQKRQSGEDAVNNLAKEMLDTEANDGRTILDYLNEDCWRAVLSYVPARDLIRTERVSRRWQALVLCRLRDVPISITVENIRRGSKTNRKDGPLKYSKYKSFEAWTSKLGSSVVATDCGSWETYEIIRVNCPNLETLRLFNFPDCTTETLPHNLNEDFKNLKRLSFSKCDMSDRCISQFIADKALEELEFKHCNEVRGQCLNIVNSSNLKSLVIERGRKLSLCKLASAVGHLSELTQLRLENVNDEIAGEIKFVLGISSLRGGAEVPGRRGARLTSLTLVGLLWLSDDDVAAIVRGCPELEWLDVRGEFLRSTLPALVEEAWRATRPRPRLGLALSASNLVYRGYVEEDGCLRAV